MECLFEVLLQLLGEFADGAGFELLAEGIGRLFSGLFRALAFVADLGGLDVGSSTTRDDSPPAAKARRANVGRVVLWTLAGISAGGLSLLVLPDPFVKAPVLHAF